MTAVLNLFNGSGGFFTSDIFIIVALFIFFFAYGLYFGKSIIISTILAFYPAQYFYQNFPFINSMLVMKGDLPLLLNKIFIFILFFVPLVILLSRYVFHESGFGGVSYLRVAGYSLCMVIIVLLFSYSVASIDPVHRFSALVNVLFSSPGRIFLWHLVPLALLFVL